ncbi:MAG TPA: hypothetical protein VKB77_12630 [Terriglobales bacterium]|nr:hypothetical protein [Terriglobales bacterium]
MTLAVILGLCLVLAPAAGSASGAVLRTPWLMMRGTEDAPQASSQTAGPPPGAPTGPPPAREKAPAENESKPKPASSATKKHAPKKQPAKATDAPAKVVVPNGSTADPEQQFSSGRSATLAPHQVQSVNQLLDATESNLKQISGRTLNVTQQDTVKQIRSYMDQAHKAVDSGDADRAQNLALKAHLLSDDLVKH